MLTQLYRHYDKSGTLLYVGISLSTVARLAQHRDTAQWFDAITDIKIETFPTREDALAAERRAIASENPTCNIRHRLTIKQVKKEEATHAAGYAQKAKQSLMARYVAYDLTYRLKELPKLLGISPRQLNSYVDQGLLHTFEVEGRTYDQRVVLVSGWALIDFMEYLEAKNAI